MRHLSSSSFSCLSSPACPLSPRVRAPSAHARTRAAAPLPQRQLPPASATRSLCRRAVSCRTETSPLSSRCGTSTAKVWPTAARRPLSPCFPSPRSHLKKRLSLSPCLARFLPGPARQTSCPCERRAASPQSVPAPAPALNRADAVLKRTHRGPCCRALAVCRQRLAVRTRGDQPAARVQKAQPGGRVAAQGRRRVLHEQRGTSGRAPALGPADCELRVCLGGARRVETASAAHIFRAAGAGAELRQHPAEPALRACGQRPRVAPDCARSHAADQARPLPPRPPCSLSRPACAGTIP